MKTLRFIGMAIMMVLVASSFISCSSDDDGDNASASKIEGVWNLTNSTEQSVLASTKGRILTLSGLDNNEQVSFYTIDGKLLGKTIAVNGTASYAISSGPVVIVRISDSSIKISVE